MLNYLEQLYVLPILLFSVVIHELSHGWMALKLGDPTARDMGRLTLNPIPHIDPVGSLAVPLISLLVTGRVFIAWAKPVPVNPMYFSNYRRDDILVSAIGPASNIILAFLCTVIFIIIAKIAPVSYYTSGVDPSNVSLSTSAFDYLLKMFGAGISLNVGLAVFNMIPIPPLDGSHVAASLMPDDLADQYRSVGFFGIFLIIMLMNWAPFASIVSGIISTLMVPFSVMINIFLR